MAQSLSLPSTKVLLCCHVNSWGRPTTFLSISAETTKCPNQHSDFWQNISNIYVFVVLNLRLFLIIKSNLTPTMVRRDATNPRERKSTRTKDGGPATDGDSTSSYKNLAFLCLLVFPSLFWLVAVGSDVVSNFGSVFGSHFSTFVVSGSLMIPVLAGYFFKPLRGLLKLAIPVLFSVLLLPTFQVYLCSPLEIKNENIGTIYSLKTTASEFLQQACEDVCLKNSKLPSSYSLTFFTPRVALRVKFNQIVDLNLTTTAMVGGEKLPIAKLVLLRSWRSVKGKYFALHIITRVPVKVKKFEEGLKAETGMILSGRVENIPTDLKRLRGELEKKRHFVRPFILEVFRATPMEA